MIRAARRSMPWAAGVLAALTGGAAFGQGNVFNPYGNSGYADYREFGSPKYAIDPSLPGAARLEGGAGLNRLGGGANQFEAYLNSLDGAGAGDPGIARGSAGLPYYRAQQLYGAQSGRAGSRLNDTPANRLYQARVAERNAAYQAALAEKDPKKRAVMLQRLDQDAIDRPLSAITNKSATPRRSGPTGAGRTPTDSVARSPEYASPVSRASAARSPARPATPPRARTATPPTAATTAPVQATPSATPAPAAAAPADSATTPTPVDPSSVPVPAPR